MTATSTPPAETLPEDDETAEFLIDFVTANLAAIMTDDPAKFPIAQRAAVRLLACHRPTDDADLILTAQMVACELTALRTLGLAQRAGLAPADTQRLQASAAALGRTADRLRRQRTRREPLMTAPVAPDDAADQMPEDAPADGRDTRAGAIVTAIPLRPAAGQPGPAGIRPGEAERQGGLGWSMPDTGVVAAHR